MKAFIILLIASFTILNFTVQACEMDGSQGIAPENDIRIPVGLKGLNDIHPDILDALYRKLAEMFTPVVQEYGGNLKVYNLWTDETVNAFASRRPGNEYAISMLGGLARFPNMTYDGLTMVFCHELGHHIGGSPLVVNHWASSEGQSDYWGAMKCMRKVLKELYSAADNQRFLQFVQIPDALRNKCDSAYTDKDERNICYRSGLAGRSLADALNRMRGNSYLVDFHLRNKDVVSKNVDEHPEAQCRLDTYVQGALCPKDITQKVSEYSSIGGVCSIENGDQLGVRPLCWYKPGKTIPQKLPEDLDYAKGKEAVTKLVEKFYDSSVNSDKEDLAESYEFPILNYFGSINLSKNEYLNQLNAYYDRWSQREGELVSIDFNDKRSNKFYYEVKLVYRYNYTLNSGKRLSGTSENIMKYKYVDGTYYISSIVESVKRDSDNRERPSDSTAFYNARALLSVYFDDSIEGDISRLGSYYSFPMKNYFGDKMTRELFEVRAKAYYSKWYSRKAWIVNLNVDEARSSSKKIVATLDYRYEFVSHDKKDYRGLSKNKFIFEWVNGQYLITSATEEVERDKY